MWIAPLHKQRTREDQPRPHHRPMKSLAKEGMNMSLESSQKAKSARLLSSSSCSRFLPCSCVGPEVSSASPGLLGSHHHGGTSRYCLYTALQLVFVTHSSSPGLSSTWTMAGRQAGRRQSSSPTAIRWRAPAWQASPPLRASSIPQAHGSMS
jgi:hypothetical protein